MVRSISSTRGQLRYAFSMIELIFAIVVIAVVMLTIPMMIGVNNKGLEVNTNQEAIFLVSAVLSETTALLWDANSLGGASDQAVSLSKILDLNATAADDNFDRWNTNTHALDTEGNYNTRKGGLEENLHRQFFSSYTAPSQGIAELNISQTFDTTETGEALGFKNQYTITASRYYVPDIIPTGTTPYVFTSVPGTTKSNVKLTKVAITTDGVEVVVLRAYTCNIGEIDFAKRRF